MSLINRYHTTFNNISKDKNGTMLFGLFIATAILFSGCSSVPDKPKVEKKVEEKVVKPKEKPKLSQDIEWLQEADKLAAANDLAAAAEFYKKIVANYPNSSSAPEAKTKLAEYFLSQGIVDEAIFLLEQAVSHDPHPNIGRAYLLLGEAHNYREDLHKSWQAWGVLSNLDAPQAIEGWRHLLEGYFAFATPESTNIFLTLAPKTALTPDQNRVLFRVANLQSKRQIDLITSLQPQTSPLLPQLILAQGDQAIRAGDKNLAHNLWARASNDPQTMQEAQYRLEKPRDQPPFKVGLMLPLSGRHKKLGNNLLHAAQKALSDYRDVPLTLFVADSGGKVDSARAAVKELHSKEVNIIIGPVVTSAAKIATFEATNLQLPIMVLNHNIEIDESEDHIYRNALRPERQAEIMANYAVLEREFDRIAILAPDSKYGHVMADAFTKEVTALNGKVVRSTFFKPNSPDFTPWIKALVHLDPKILHKRIASAKKTIPLDPSDPLPPTEVKNLDAWTDFDALFLPTLAKQIRLIAPQAAFYNIRSPQVTLLGTSSWNRQSLFKGGTEYLRGAVFLDTDRQLRDQFRMAFHQAWEEDPTSLASLTYDGVAVVAQLVREQRMGGLTWQEGLADSEGFAGSAGRIQFQKSGESQRPYQLFRFARRGVTTIPPTKNTKHILNIRKAVIDIPTINEEEN
ncbi:MAG: penicillin-binding protein activator [Magnetococcales bacterium]|nr:penicillin-binding protein activator [Magnetococcales bacterium]